MRAVRIPVPAEPARAFLAVIRKSYVEKSAKGQIEAAVYLDAITRLAEAGRRVEPGRPASVAAFFEACGFDKDRKRHSTAAAVVERTRLLKRAGFPVDEWTAWWGANQGLAEPERGKYIGALVSATADADEVPALLPPDAWASILGRHAADTLAGSILADRRAALLYYGLFALDDETLSYVSRSPALVSSLARTAGEFAAFSDGVAIRQGRMALPGGQGAVALWEQLVGAPASAPDRFIEKLFSQDDGRLARLFDAVSHLDAPHQAFALGDAAEDSATRLAELRSLYSVFAAFEPNTATVADKPFSRSTPDPAFILAQLAVSGDGRLAPADPAFWRAVLPPSESGPTFAASAQVVTAASIVGQVASQSIPMRRRAYLDAVLFAQRLAAAQAANASMPLDVTASAVAAFVTRPALMATLECLGFVDPADYAQAASSTDSLSRGDARRATLALAQFQGALALLVRLHDVGAIAPGAAQDLARALIAASGEELSVAAWLDTRLLPALPRAATATAHPAEDQLLDALAGVSAARRLPTVGWEDHAYRVDVAAAERTRLRRIREKQADVTVDEAIDFYRAWSRLLRVTTPAEITEAAEQVRQSMPKSNLLGGDASLFGHSVPRMQESIVGVVRGVAAKRVGAARPEATERLNEATEVLFADLLASLAYALAIGDPDTAALLAGNPARLHEFTLSMPSSVGWWRIPEEIRGGPAGQQLIVRGSLLALDRALGRDWARPMSFDLPDIGRRMPPEDLRGMGEAIAALNPYSLTDADRDRLVAGLRRGRERIAAARSPSDLESLAQQAGVEGQRRRLIRLAVASDPGAVWQYLSLAEILYLGTQDSRVSEFQGWGLPRRPLDGCLGVWFPRVLGWQQMAGRPMALLMSAHVVDLQLHVAEVLDELRLPSVLVPAVLSLATWDVAMGSPMTDADDWLGLVRGAQALSRDRISDYVSALTADGALVPVEVR